MSIQLRQDVLCQARRVVIKLGTFLLTLPDSSQGELDLPFLRSVARQVLGLHNNGFEVTLVMSGAIGAGCAELGLAKRPRDVSDLQAVAAVGQRRLMTYLHEAFDKLGLKVAQLLLTRTDFDDRVRFLNIRNCVTHLHRLGCIPVINENDTVSVDELRFGDNDQLAAMMANALRSDALILLFTKDGLLDEQNKPIDLVDNIQSAINLVRDDKTEMGSGGMASKVEAARLVAEAGEIAVIANGRQKNVLARIFAGEQIGTVFLPAKRRLDSRQRWIGMTKRPAGTVTIDHGAANALQNSGKSLLATGLLATTGQFERGDLLLIRNENGHDLARGLTNYSSDELRLISGKRSNQFEKILGRKAYDEVIHRDNLVLSCVEK